MNLVAVETTVVQAVKDEDAHSILNLETVDGNCVVVAVMDGHGGARAAHRCRDRLEDIVVADRSSPVALGDSFFSDVRCDPVSQDHATQFFERVFASLHSECLAVQGTSGTTLTLCVFNERDGNFVCANVGDSLAVHFSTTASHTCLTVSHRLQDNPDERMRLRSNLHFATDRNGVPRGPVRLYPGGLACSRSLGDGDCLFLSCTPSISKGRLTPDSVVVVASDGLWDATTLQQVKHCAIGVSGGTHTLRRQLHNATDDVTMLCVKQNVGTVNRPRRASFLWRPIFRSSSSSSVSSDDDGVATRCPVKTSPSAQREVWRVVT
mgnify:CR=1 FL=1|tara:strand:- start:1919 stop:2884 length:966 start_codon:yes stop_codon:yes gene_type:complete